MKKTIGGDRLGAGKKMQVDLHGYERSTHDLGYLWRSTMSAGTLVPFMVEVGLPGDTFDINLDCIVKTHPTVGPLFGSYKVQADTFLCPIRLYQGQLHNNKLGIGMNMANVKLPQITLYVDPDATIDNNNPDNAQINPSCILSYLNIRGVGIVNPAEADLVPRDFNGLSLLMYWDIFKNYYSNKMEELGYVIHKELLAIITTVDEIRISTQVIPQLPLDSPINVANLLLIEIDWTGTQPLTNQIVLYTDKGQVLLSDVGTSFTNAGTTISGLWYDSSGISIVYSWDYLSNSNLPAISPTLKGFDLGNIDRMREGILQAVSDTSAFNINTYATAESLTPYTDVLQWIDNLSPYLATQEGLAVKTYQSDKFNNWLNTEWIDGTNGINEITSIDTSGGSFTIDTLNLSNKVYQMLNRIAISGGTYDDWLDAVYTHDRYIKAETPMYMGGLIKELVFQEVVSNAESSSFSGSENQPLGTLGGKGVMSGKHKGGKIRIKVDEPSYIIGIISLTPRIDNSQGNKWDVHLKTMDDFHKPALDEIGFQDLIAEEMAWFSTQKTGATFVQASPGKQPAWINYMTNVNQTRGNFAIPDNEMFMTLNRRYEKGGAPGEGWIKDLTTYIDPVKFNGSFAQTSIDAQNFWTQMSVDITARRKMSAKLMPNL